MNFLAHYYSAVPASPPFIVGTILPDLVRMYDRRNRLQPLSSLQEHDLKEINQGILWHIKVDKWFHHTSFFKKNVSFIKAQLRAASLHFYPRFLYFVAHILLELLIDRGLVKHHPEETQRFYTQLQQVDKEQLFMYLNKHNDVYNKRGFGHYWQQFIDKQYIFDYLDNESFVYALNKVIERVGNKGFKSEDYPRLFDCIEYIEKEKLSFSKLERLFQKLNIHVKVT